MTGRIDICRVPKEGAEKLIQELRLAGYTQACIVGQVQKLEQTPHDQHHSTATIHTGSPPAKQITIVGSGAII